MELSPTERPPLDELVMLQSSTMALLECEMWRMDPFQEHTRDWRCVLLFASLRTVMTRPVNEQSLRDDIDIEERVITVPVCDGETQ
jgi:hypothetical protein